ncbi:MAG: rRNA maturation RNase YbeY [Planctomycetota bacterium]|nr:rRNA maturation RNase YbeY [Planctomycetota bacterium]
MRHPAPLILVTVTRSAGAPAMPDKNALARLFQRAWELALRPAGGGNPRLAVDVHIVGDARIAALNVIYLQQAGPTDVLAFSMGETDPERKALHLGEIVVNHEAAKREAASRRIPVLNELERYCVHGFLHLLGYEDETTAQRRAMCRAQEKVLRSSHSSHS